MLLCVSLSVIQSDILLAEDSSTEEYAFRRQRNIIIMNIYYLKMQKQFLQASDGNEMVTPASTLDLPYCIYFKLKSDYTF